jgi:hypothetical protein
VHSLRTHEKSRLGELNGKERTAAEFRELLAGAGFRLDRVIDIGFNTFLLESSVV